MSPPGPRPGRCRTHRSACRRAPIRRTGRASERETERATGRWLRLWMAPSSARWRQQPGSKPRSTGSPRTRRSRPGAQRSGGWRAPGPRTLPLVGQASANATLRSRIATVTGDPPMSEQDARARDVAGSPTPPTRDRFHIPIAADGSPTIYLAGQSLGLQPTTAAAAITTEMEAWAPRGVDAWFDPGRPWFTLDGSLREPMGRIVGAKPVEVALLNSLTVDIHLLLASFFRPAGGRRRILADGPLFPSDRHALRTHLAQRGLDPDADLIVVDPRADEHLVRIEDLEAAIASHGDDLALVFLGGVNFAT